MAADAGSRQSPGKRRRTPPLQQILSPSTIRKGTAAMSARRPVAPEGVASSCYFRTSTISPERKALLQITERCNLHCAHCFVSAIRDGTDIPLQAIRSQILPQLAHARVARLTLTGGEPFAHPDVLEIVRAGRQARMTVTICTNGTLISEAQMDQLQGIGGVACNVSLDGFTAESHGRFRGNPASFQQTVATVRALGERGLLKGLLATPNTLAEAREFAELCAFARDCGAEYVLMNPLASMGRGVRGARRLASAEGHLREIARLTDPFAGADLDVVRIRFPNDSSAPLSGCEAGTIIYVFATGEVTVCPYLVFAARTPASKHAPEDFIVGNILTDQDIARRLDSYRLHDRKKVAADPTCGSCAMASGCGRGCPAAVIATGGRLGERDREQCPVPDEAQAAA
jgi:radical SAM protein with 4Fe4S-binding SPASM domain